MATDRAVGMMNEAYFVGRREIIDWLNELLSLNLSKVEETANGAVVCQVMDALFPGTVPMKKVNWGARSDHEFVSNYKVLQAVFDKLSITRHIPVDRLIRAKYQDNLEHLQWVRSVFMDHEGNIPEDYDAIGRRNLGKGVNLYKPAQGGAVKPAARKPVSRPAPRTTTAAPRASTTTPTTTATKSVAPSRVTKEKENQSRTNRVSTSSSSSRADSKSAEKIEELQQQVKDLQNSNADLKLNLEGAEKESQFYFSKLRDVELLLQAYSGPDRDIVLNVLKVLYATEDDPKGEAALAAAESVLATTEEEDDEEQHVTHAAESKEVLGDDLPSQDSVEAENSTSSSQFAEDY
mmetsp:Transcript_2945/g.6833  ORF Transcript_2945/g.6833 Transcript_2945/m.6833 type:complete len:349 (+) Transcript_2945:400-1446(+)|eukprot:CAMPEP_0171501114 /NCGR_PEP_ID=MMETSP0958-20121227/9381_1 /TAXON_ID=87120 /ORGANISM="Aurantiochytrium limacinum, Strain ATCCMYA-1381" /LENGTH=348 /DNA_ID=CAMNT_0012035899 /DNA_START=304 /DNA_END=1350 /DNA_ORIENTATION=+